MAGQAIGYLEAWSAWADGTDIRSRVLWGLEIYWWARISKVAAFLGGLVIVLDILGEERLKAYLAQRKAKSIGWLSYASWMVIPLIISIVVTILWMQEPRPPFSWVWGPAVILAATLGVTDTRRRLFDVYSWLCDHKNAMRSMRAGSLLLLLAAFHFDFLAS